MHIDELPQAVKRIMSAQPLNNLHSSTPADCSEAEAKAEPVVASAISFAPLPADGVAGRNALVSMPLETILSE